MQYILLFSLILASFFAHAESLPQHHNVQCGADFLCPPDLQRRVDFWVDVYALHDKNTAIFHDRDAPERIYSVVKRKGSCGGRHTPPAIKRERTRISTLLKRIAKKKQAGEALVGEEKRIAALFAGEKPEVIRKAAKQVRCQTGNSTRFREGVRRYGEHSGKIQAALKEFGLPDGVQFLPFVESSYNPAAYSRVGAAGLWQLMPATARHLGLEVNPVLDERMDPALATLAAIRYLQKSFQALAPVAREIDPSVSKAEIFPFVITSYNYGVNGMKRAMREVGVNFVDVLEKYKSKSFQVAVKNFYASFLAARHVAMNAEQFFPDQKPAKPVETAQFALQKPRLAKTLVSHFGISKSRLKKLNPALAKGVWQNRHLIPRGYVVNLPKKHSGSWAGKIASLAKKPADKAPHRSRRYRVRRGDSACGIARKFKVSCRKLIRENRLGRRGFIRVRQILTIPGGSIVLNKTLADARQRIFGDEVFSSDAIMDLPVELVRTPDRTYKVASGDSTCKIAAKFAMSCDEFARVTKLGKNKKLKVGQVLTIPGEEKRVVRMASDEKDMIAARLDYAYLKSIVAHWEDDDDVVGSAQQSPIKKAGQKAASPVAASPVAARPAGPQSRIKKGVNVVVAPASASNFDNFISMTAESPGQISTESTAQQVAQSFGSTDEYYVAKKKKGGKTRWLITVQPDEALGLYADWLGGGVSSRIRRLNGMSHSRHVQLGQKMRLPIKNEKQKKQFEEKRIAYHRALQSQFFEHFHVTGSKSYTVRRGDTGLGLASRNKIPLWLLRRFNPDIFKRRLKAGEKIVLPQIESV